MYEAIFALHNSMISSEVALLFGFRTTRAFTASPQVSSGTPMTAASATAGWLSIACSTSRG